MQPVVLHASARRAPTHSVAVIPVQDGSGDVTTRELVESLQTALPQLGAIHVVATDRIESLAPYQTRNPAPDELTTRLAAAKAAYLHFANRKALQLATAIAEDFQRHPDWQHRYGHILADALLTQAMVFHSERNTTAMQKALHALATTAPFYAVPASEYPPTVVNAWHRARGHVQRQSGRLIIDSHPAVANVSLNGIAAGVTPLTLTEVPAGEYLVSLTAPRYRADQRTITIRAGATETVRARLRWTSEGRSQQPHTQDQLREALRYADQAKTDRALIVNVDAQRAQRGMIRMQLIDRSLRARVSAVELPYHAQRADLHQQLAAATERIAHAIINGPEDAHQLMPIDVGGTLLAARPRKKMSPWVWGGVGAAVVGGIVTAIVLGNGGGAASTGGLVLQFR